MVIFRYDKTFEGLLTAVFDAYFRRTFPDRLLAEGEPLPLFYEEEFTVCTDDVKADRVWKGLKKKLSPSAVLSLAVCWHSELPEVDGLLFRYIRKAIDAPHSIELNFGDADVLELSNVWKKVNQERLRMMQFIRFQKASDGTFFAALEPLYDVLPFAVTHFKERFGDQCWLIYDLRRGYGFYYDLQSVNEVRFEAKEAHLLTGLLDGQLMDADELLFQRLWKQYFQSITIRERINPRLHRQVLPARFWKYLTEKQP